MIKGATSLGLAKGKGEGPAMVLASSANGKNPVSKQKHWLYPCMFILMPVHCILAR